jgi:hypothetical protein
MQQCKANTGTLINANTTLIKAVRLFSISVQLLKISVPKSPPVFLLGFSKAFSIKNFVPSPKNATMSNPSLRAHPKFLSLITMLQITHGPAVGYLECLWHAAFDTGDPDLGTAFAVEAAAGWMGEPGKLCHALLRCGCGRAGFIEEVPDKPGFYRLHDLVENSPADLVRKWVRRQDRLAKGKTISEIRSAAARARWDKVKAKEQACKSMQTAEVCMPLHAPLECGGSPPLCNTRGTTENNYPAALQSDGKPSHSMESCKPIQKPDVCMNLHAPLDCGGSPPLANARGATENNYPAALRSDGKPSHSEESCSNDSSPFALLRKQLADPNSAQPLSRQQRRQQARHEARQAVQKEKAISKRIAAPAKP